MLNYSYSGSVTFANAIWFSFLTILIGYRNQVGNNDNDTAAASTDEQHLRLFLIGAYLAIRNTCLQFSVVVINKLSYVYINYVIILPCTLVFSLVFTDLCNNIAS